MEYYIVNKDNKKVEVVIRGGDSVDISVLYPDKITILVPDTSTGIPRAYSGCIYDNGVFYSPLLKNSKPKVPDNCMTYMMMRNMFSEEELNKFDSFELDNNISDEVKYKLRTMFKNLEVVGTVDKNNDIFKKAALYLLSIGYITQGRYDSIKDSIGGI